MTLGSAMASADQLVEQMYRWMEIRQTGASQLRSAGAATRRWERRELLGSSAALVGAVLLVWSGLLAIFAGCGNTTVFSALGLVYLSLGALTNLLSKILKRVKTGGLTEKAGFKLRWSELIFDDISAEFELVKRSLQAGPEQERGDVVEEILLSVAKRVGFNVSDLDFSSVVQTYRSTSLSALLPSLQTPPLCFEGCVWSILKVFGLKLEDDLTDLFGALRTSEVAVNVAETRSIYQSCDSGPRSRDCRHEQHDHVPADSQSQREMADRILEGVEELRGALDGISSAMEELKDVRECIEDPMCVCRRTALLNYAQRHCPNAEVRQWLQEGALSEHFLHLVDVFYHMKAKIQKEKKKRKRRRKKTRRRVMDVVFVAHGCISDSVMCSELLLPLPSIQHLLLYQPWNCTIDASVAYGIATGSIQPEHRLFRCDRNCPYVSHSYGHLPVDLPRDWNHIRTPGGELIPEIWVQTLNDPDPAWNEFLVLRRDLGRPGAERVVVPFILPGQRALQMPFHVVTLALSLVLLFSRLRARLHLVACLGSASGGTYLDLQYCCAPDHTMMKSSQIPQCLSGENQQLLNNLTDIFH